MNILFLCTHNACRSILAEAITNALGNVKATSAGSHPAENVHPDTLLELKRRGYSTDGLATLSMDVAAAEPPDVVVTVCDRAAGEACPVWLDHTPRVHWGLPDPTHPGDAGKTSAELFDEVIDTLERRARILGREPAPSDTDEFARLLTELGAS